MKCEWRPVVGYESTYEVSNAGDALIDSLFSTPYENDLIRLYDTSGGTPRPVGFGRLGRFHLTSFETIFGF